MYADDFKKTSYIHTRDNTIIVCHVICEDGRFFVLRTDVNDPEEFRISQKNVNYIFH